MVILFPSKIGPFKIDQKLQSFYKMDCNKCQQRGPYLWMTNHSFREKRGPVLWFIIPAHVKQKNCWRFKASLGHRLCCSKKNWEGVCGWECGRKATISSCTSGLSLSFPTVGVSLAMPICAPGGSCASAQELCGSTNERHTHISLILKCLGYSKA